MAGSVFSRRESESRGTRLGAGAYNLVIGTVLVWGFLVNWLMVKNISHKVIIDINPWIFYIGYFIACILGIALFTKSKNPFVSFIGYNFVVVPFGLIVNLLVYQYDKSLVVEAMRVTGLVTAAMMILGSMFPGFFRKIGRALMISLLVVIVVELVEVFIFKVHHGFIDWVVALIFCGYVGFDWGRANAIPKTLDNAVDSAASLYMDIINLFLRILRIMGGRRS